MKYCKFIALATVLYGFSFSQETLSADKNSVERGRKVYLKSCVACHGKSGEGNGPAAPELNPPPRDFTMGLYKFRSTLSGELPTDEDLMRTVNWGTPGTEMPAFNNILTPREKWDVVQYIKTFSPDFADFGPGEPMLIPDPPPATPELIQEGKYVYMFLACWDCHGVAGKGDGPSSPTLRDDWDLPIQARDFTQGGFKGGSSLKQIYQTTLTGVDGTPMAGYKGLFGFAGDTKDDPERYKALYSEEEVQGLLAYMEAQPTQDQLAQAEEEKKDKLIERRRWALTHYVNSLVKGPGLFYRLFIKPTDVTDAMPAEVE